MEPSEVSAKPSRILPGSVKLTVAVRYLRIASSSRGVAPLVGDAVADAGLALPVVAGEVPVDFAVADDETGPGGWVARASLEVHPDMVTIPARSKRAVLWATTQLYCQSTIHRRI